MLQRTEEPFARSKKILLGRKSGALEICTLEEALALLEKGMLQPSPSPPPPSVVDNIACILHKCRKAKNPSYAMRLHACLCENGLEAHKALGNLLVSLLVEVGCIPNAQQVFNSLVYRNECSWTSLITGFIKYGKSQHAFILYQKMQEDSVQPSGYTFVALLKACSKLRDMERGRSIHADVARQGLERDLFVGSALVDMYAKFDLLEKAQEVFDKLLVRDAVSWNALIAAYAKHGRAEEALHCFKQMEFEGVSPNIVTYVCSLKACGSIGATDMGQEIHAEIARQGLEKDLIVGNTLVDMYGNCGLLAKAQEIFDKLPARDVVSWTALIAGYAKHGHGEEALKYFEQMRLEGVFPDVVTFVCSLKACGIIGAGDKGQEIHDAIARKGSLGRNPVVGNALVDMYAKCGWLAKAQDVLDKLPARDAISWNALIAGYAKQGLGEEALNCFEQMQSEGISPDAITFSCCLKACGSIGATDKGREIHAEITRKRLLETDFVVGNALVDMYAKCGLLDKAQEVLEKLPVRDLVSWNALIAGYAQLGESENVFFTLDRMRGEDKKPNVVTFGSVLNACIHGGLVVKGQAYFEAMIKDHGIIPTLEHHTCIVDLLGRAGQLDKAVAMVKKMPVHPTLVVWNTVLGACRKWGNVELGRQVFEHVVQLEEKDAAAYVCMYNIYADADMLEDAKKIEAIRVKKQAWEMPGHNLWTDAG